VFGHGPGGVKNRPVPTRIPALVPSSASPYLCAYKPSEGSDWNQSMRAAQSAGSCSGSAVVSEGPLVVSASAAVLAFGDRCTWAVLRVSVSSCSGKMGAGRC
jgi:hypothetical protein